MGLVKEGGSLENDQFYAFWFNNERTLLSTADTSWYGHPYAEASNPEYNPTYL